MSKKKHPAARTGGTQRTPIIGSVIIKPPVRRVYDVGDWRAALRAADNGRVKQLYDLYDDAMIDGVLSDAVQKRIDAVTNSELTFQTAEGEEVPEITALMETTAWETLLSEIARVRIYGRAAVEFGFTPEFSVTPIPPKHINLDRKVILREDSDDDGFPYEGDGFLLVLGHRRDFGLLLKAVPYAIYKRGGFGDWSQWLELFGMPRRVGKYNTYDPESRRLLEEAFEKAGSAPYVIIPKEAEVDTQESGSGNGASYDEFRRANNEEILITILGQTMTTVQGDKGARSLGEVHKEVEEGKNRSDLRFVERVLNQKVVPVLEARGYPVSGGRFIFPQAVEQLSVNDVVQLSSVLDIPQSYLHDKYAIPAPQDGEPLARSMTASPFGLPSTDDGDSEIRNSDRTFLQRLKDFFVKAPHGGATAGSPRMLMNDGATMEDRLISGVAAGELQVFSPELFNHISGDLISAVRPAFRRNTANADTSYAYGLRDDAFVTALEMNLFHFSAGKTLAEIQALNGAFRESSSYTDFEKRAREICGTFNRTWQRTEYETAVLAAESASNYHRLMAKKKLFPFWKYVTAGDDRVRKEHRALDGVILGCDDPLWKKIYPPNGWKCRCRVAPLMRHEAAGVDPGEMRRRVSEYFDTAEWKAASAQGWDTNRSETAQVFTKDQQYIRKFPGKAAKSLLQLYPQDYGLESLNKRIAASVTPRPVYAGAADSWYDAHQVLEDYMGRRVSLRRKVFNFHTTGAHSYRVPYLDCVTEALKDPDEVWLNNYSKGTGEFTNLNFIKFYDDSAVNVVCEIKEGRVYEVKTWFEICTGPKGGSRSKASRLKDPRWKYRRGLLIKKS